MPRLIEKMQVTLTLFVFLAETLCVRAGQHFIPDRTYTAPNGSSTYPASTYCCGALEAAGFGSRVEYSGEEAYQASIDSYWSSLEHLTPWCLVQPLNTEEVSKIVATLVTASKEDHECRFAVRSGGHMTWAGAANIDDGVTIDLSYMNSTTYHAENSTAAILPGARWESVYATLDALNVSSPGGRCNVPGVGGLVTGGGVSFFNARKGFVCDSVANFEVVLANGDIVNANSQENSDLFQVLKGGGNNFGIVTRIDMETFDNNGLLWGGLLQYPSSTMPQHVKAFTHFTDNVEKDPNASTIMFVSFNSEETGDIGIFNSHVYTEPVVQPPAYDEFNAIPGKIFDTSRITNMSDLVAEVPLETGWRQLMMTCTFQNDEEVLSKVVELYRGTAEKLNGTSGTWTFGNQYHPIPKIFAQHSVEKGGNILGLELMLTLVQWDEAENDETFINANKQLIDDVIAHSRSVGKADDWLYLNYAWQTQDVLNSYGPDNVAKMRAASSKYDPDGVFQRLVPGGFKISDVDK
ncbi:FAD binding domain containing protein [Lasiodiplodia theobromae]|uniref:FAD binding domain containing protein n=1 Tax=Lasiodiplodia theobromae TaxID=45133 RepID=UPI0015C3824C|nr:FAD binding domain containing protein [Lasiodiplodia theobromae]KAF4539823.1 FAD binding domain containing protein [Lasiodiplodia theobromae]